MLQVCLSTQFHVLLRQPVNAFILKYKMRYVLLVNRNITGERHRSCMRADSAEAFVSHRHQKSMWEI